MTTPRGCRDTRPEDPNEYARTLPTPFAVRMADVHMTSILRVADGGAGMSGDGLSARRPQRSIVNNTKNKNLSRALRGGLAALALTGASVAMVGPAANAADGATWDALAQCESGGSWSTSTGNGFSGDLQFTPSTWAAHGGTGSAENASRAEQIAVAEKVLDEQGSAPGRLTRPAGAVRRRRRRVAGEQPVCRHPAGTSPAAAGSRRNRRRVAEAPVQQQAPVEQAPVQQAPAPAAAPAVKGFGRRGETYAVQSGDTLASIAESMGLQGGWEDLFAANADTVSDPNLIFVGQVLQAYRAVISHVVKRPRSPPGGRGVSVTMRPGAIDWLQTE